MTTIARKSSRLVAKLQKIPNYLVAIAPAPKGSSNPSDLNHDPSAIYVNKDTLLELIEGEATHAEVDRLKAFANGLVESNVDIVAKWDAARAELAKVTGERDSTFFKVPCSDCQHLLHDGLVPECRAEDGNGKRFCDCKAEHRVLFLVKAQSKDLATAHDVLRLAREALLKTRDEAVRIIDRMPNISQEPMADSIMRTDLQRNVFAIGMDALTAIDDALGGKK